MLVACEYYNPDNFCKKVQEEPSSATLADLAKVLQNLFDKNVKPLPHCTVKSGRHMAGAMRHSPTFSENRRLHQAPKKSCPAQAHSEGGLSRSNAEAK